MIVWCFEGSNGLWALTDDETGAGLPAEHGPWLCRRSVELLGVQPDERKAMELIRDHGFCCFEGNTSAPS